MIVVETPGQHYGLVSKAAHIYCTILGLAGAYLFWLYSKPGPALVNSAVVYILAFRAKLGLGVQRKRPIQLTLPQESGSIRKVVKEPGVGAGVDLVIGVHLVRMGVLGLAEGGVPWDHALEPNRVRWVALLDMLVTGLRGLEGVVAGTHSTVGKTANNLKRERNC